MYKKLIENKKAVIFDLDGTVIDNLPLWREAYERVFKAVLPNKFLPEGIESGKSLKEGWTNLMEEYDLSNTYTVEDLISKTKSSYINLLDETEIEERPGFLVLNAELREKGLKTAIATNSSRLILDKILDKLYLRDLLDLTIAGDEVKNPKPAPDIYIKAAKRLKVSPKNILVFEDSVAGATAAKKAKMDLVIIINENHFIEEYPGNILEHLTDFEPLAGNLDLTTIEYLEKRAKEETIQPEM